MNKLKDPDAPWNEHTKFSEYAGFLEQSLKPECQDCGYAMNFTASLALRVIQRAAKLNRCGTRIVSIDSSIEETELLAAQREIQDVNRPCKGPILVEDSVEAQANWIDSRVVAGDFSPEFAERKKSELIPFSETCDLMRQHEQSPPNFPAA